MLSLLLQPLATRTVRTPTKLHPELPRARVDARPREASRRLLSAERATPKKKESPTLARAAGLSTSNATES
jgi:hypothetical protein